MLGGRQVHEVKWRFKNREVPAGHSHSNNLNPRAIRTDTQPLANRISLKKVPCELFIDDSNKRRIGAIRGQESAPGYDRDAECLEIRVAHVIAKDARALMIYGKLLLFGNYIL